MDVAHWELISAVEEARAAWIHHVSAPRILAALWLVRHPSRPCEHPSHTVPDTYDESKRFCSVCGEYISDERKT